MSPGIRYKKTSQKFRHLYRLGEQLQHDTALRSPWSRNSQKIWTTYSLNIAVRAQPSSFTSQDTIPASPASKLGHSPLALPVRIKQLGQSPQASPAAVRTPLQLHQSGHSNFTNKDNAVVTQHSGLYQYSRVKQPGHKTKQLGHNQSVTIQKQSLRAKQQEESSQNTEVRTNQSRQTSQLGEQSARTAIRTKQSEQQSGQSKPVRTPYTHTSLTCYTCPATPL